MIKKGKINPMMFIKNILRKEFLLKQIIKSKRI